MSPFEISPWIIESVKKDLCQIKAWTYTKDEIISAYKYRHFAVLVEIKNNRILPTGLVSHPRFSSIYEMLKNLAEHDLPDTIFWMDIGDELSQVCEAPIFVMAKKNDYRNQIMYPDFEVLNANYQVLDGKDIAKLDLVFDTKKPVLVWRGGTAQGEYTMSNYNQKTRVKLCKLSIQYPELINAAFSSLNQGAESIPELIQLVKPKLSYEDMINYKYLMWIDGNTASFTASGWRFFVNSVVIKPDSNYVQWYYNLLTPDVNYVQVKEDLTDLVVKIQALNANPERANVIAQAGLQLAREHLTQNESMKYLYYLIWEYSKRINIIDFSPISLNAGRIILAYNKAFHQLVGRTATIDSTIMDKDIIELAEGKKYYLSSSYGDYSKNGIVSDKMPFFFHSGFGVCESITIDLEVECQFISLEVMNRSDGYRERARCLFYVIHNDMKPDLEHGLPLFIDDIKFWTEEGHPSITKLMNTIGSYITIFSPEYTALHLFSIKVMGKKYSLTKSAAPLATES